MPFRYNEKETIMVIVNNNITNEKISTSRFKESIKNFTKGTNIFDENTISINKEIEIKAKSILILELK